MNKAPVLIVGMARSGTTLVSHILGSLPGVHIEVEPHALWKSGNFKYLNDEEYDDRDKIAASIRNKLTKDLSGKVLIEKSPINCLRPNLVYKVFPDAKIVYIERNPVRCIYSNYTRSLKRDSFKLSIILKKYFVYTGSEDLKGAISERGLFKQISFKDIPRFLQYTARMFYLRQVAGTLPFGPKLKNFATIVKKKGLLYYHVAVFKAAQRYKKIYSELYGKNMQTFSMENIMNDHNEIKRMLDFLQFSYSEVWINNIQGSFDSERVKESAEPQAIDKEILALLDDNDTGNGFS
ncbi:sulfotransferase [Panacibacter ginsenosidivorans]|uniref:Sulfotransferase n=1 Tax=Panacibacter ginsenosidivorans TaxID=1813871 RepID=A0A5B8VD39_9BACT|nr:sulfotransferase [Panacibacter ginsenosidivorans]QEC68566.1 sulfotransferase [Panacibacter ginsenosidivorans]